MVESGPTQQTVFEAPQGFDYTQHLLAAEPTGRGARTLPPGGAADPAQARTSKGLVPDQDAD